MRHWTGSAPSHYLNHCWLIVNLTIKNKFQRDLNPTSNIFIQENVSENIVCEMAAILSRGRWVNDNNADNGCYGDVNCVNYNSPTSYTYLKARTPITLYLVAVSSTLVLDSHRQSNTHDVFLILETIHMSISQCCWLLKTPIEMCRLLNKTKLVPRQTMAGLFSSLH